MKPKILIVDVELHMVNLLERIIAAETEYHIVTTHNALEIPQILTDSVFDIVITELDMPGFGGLDILDTVRRGNRGEEVIIITAFASLAKAVDAFTNGACDFIVKPLKKERLFDAIERAEKRRRWREQSCCLEELMRREPYTVAMAQFKNRYLRCMAAATGHDIGKMADRSGLSRAEIENALKYENPLPDAKNE